MTEKPLFHRLEGAASGGFRLTVQRAILAGDVCGLHGGVEMGVDDGESPGVGVVNPALFVGQFMFDQFVFDAVVGKGPCGVETERPQIARQNLHGGDAAFFDRFHEFGAGCEGKIVAAPETEPLGVGEIMNAGGAGG